MVAIFTRLMGGNVMKKLSEISVHCRFIGQLIDVRLAGWRGGSFVWVMFAGALLLADHVRN